jgi:hypothetical protein
MDRRNFMGSIATGSAGLALSTNLLLNHAHAESNDGAVGSDFDKLTKNLLVDWCDGMLRRQINKPDDPAVHGALGCPACEHIHGRCSDALYPFLHLAHVTGDKKYLKAAIDVYEWAENNVSQPDGSWRVSTRPKTWRGTSIFGAIALAEALHFHGEVLDEKRRAQWMARLDKAAGGYLYRDFKKIDFTNLNYGMTGVYGFHLFGQLLKKQKFTDRSHQFAERVKEFFTEPNFLLWGEGKPNNNRSGRGLLPVDLGYNVEESLNGAILYALEVDDTEMLNLLVKTMNGHLEFMLPDGAWDNSWGTRSQKWSYWGSRTSDGCQPGFSLMADRNPAFGTAAMKNAQLLERCTSDGLLHGGPHYVSHGVKPCIHHTFAHAKVMAFVQDRMQEMPMVDTATPLPRETANGVKHFPELAVWLAAKGPWRATVSAYDSIYKTKKHNHLQQPTGGSLSVLYHNKVGTLLAGSMARYIMVEPFNMQEQPGEEFPLTPRIEVRKGDQWFTNLYDLKTDVSFKEDASNITFDVKGTMVNEAREPVENESSSFKLNYIFDADKVTVSVPAAEAPSPQDRTLVLPVLSPTGEEVRVVSENRIEITKPDGTVVIECNSPLSIKKTEKERVFNMVPGAEAVPIMVEIPAGQKQKIELTISVT